jgi:hypothetical protein
VDFTILSFVQGVLFSLLVLVVGKVNRFTFSIWAKIFILIEFILLFAPYILAEKIKIISLIVLNGHLVIGLLTLIFIYRQKLSLRILTEKYIQDKLKKHPAIADMVLGEIQAILPIIVLLVFAGLAWGIYYGIQLIANF